MAAHSKLPCRRWNQFSVAKRDTGRHSERSRQPSVDRAVCTRSAPALTSNIRKGLRRRVKRVGNVSSDLAERPQGRADVARFYAASSPRFVFNLAARLNSSTRRAYCLRFRRRLDRTPKSTPSHDGHLPRLSAPILKCPLHLASRSCRRYAFISSSEAATPESRAGLLGSARLWCAPKLASARHSDLPTEPVKDQAAAVIRIIRDNIPLLKLLTCHGDGHQQPKPPLALGVVTRQRRGCSS